MTAQAITWPRPFFPQSHGREILIRLTGPLGATQLFPLHHSLQQNKKSTYAIHSNSQHLSNSDNSSQCLKSMQLKVSQECFCRAPRPLICDGWNFFGEKKYCLVSLFSRTTSSLRTSQMLVSLSMKKAGLLNLFLWL